MFHAFLFIFLDFLGKQPHARKCIKKTCYHEMEKLPEREIRREEAESKLLPAENWTAVADSIINIFFAAVGGEKISENSLEVSSL